jgi:hypothetical protein
VRTRLAVLMAALSMALLSACTTATAGTPEAASSAHTSTPSEPTSDEEGLPSDGAPKVENPLDAARFEQNPCELLTPDQAQQLNVPATGEQTEDSTGESCDWENSQTHGAARVWFASSDKRGLSSVYREGKGVGWPYFEPLDIDGRPAVAYHTKQKEPRDDCSVAVGLSDQLAFDVRVDLSDDNIDKKNPCEIAEQVAGMMLETMQEAA